MQLNFKFISEDWWCVYLKRCQLKPTLVNQIEKWMSSEKKKVSPNLHVLLTVVAAPCDRASAALCPGSSRLGPNITNNKWIHRVTVCISSGFLCRWIINRVSGGWGGVEWGGPFPSANEPITVHSCWRKVNSSWSGSLENKSCSVCSVCVCFFLK